MRLFYTAAFERSKPPFLLSSKVIRKRQIKGRVDRCEKIVVERIEMFHHY